MLLRTLVHYLKPHRWYLLGVVVLQTLAAFGTLYLPTLNAEIIDNGVATGNTHYIWVHGAIMLGVSLAQILASVGGIYCAAKASMRMGRDMRNDIYSRVTGFSEREVREFGTGSLITRNTNDVQQVQMMAMMSTTMLINAPLMAIGGVIMALRLDVSLSWLIAASVPVIVVIAGTLISQLVPLFRAYQERLDTVNLVMREQLTGLKVIRAFVREKVEEKRFGVANTNIMVVGRKVGSLFVLMQPLVTVVLNVTVVGVYWFGAARIDSGQMEIGTVLAFVQYVAQILMGVLMATFMSIMIPRAAVSAERIQAVLNTESAVREPEDPKFAMPTPGQVQMRGATFSYPDAEGAVLEDVSFTAEPGSTVGIIGSTGSGKSTLVSLVPRLFDVTAGDVLVGGVDVRQLDLATLWGSIGYVPQKAFLFAGTVRSNLLFGKPDATEEEMWAALSAAQADGFVKEMRGGLDAKIAQGGTNVSGGQRQRLSIARALIKGAPLLIFDDSFSALDLTTDANLWAALHREYPETTKLVVAQRISTISEADHILVLDRGRAVGWGTHEELAQTCSTYQEIIESQLAVEAA